MTVALLGFLGFMLLIWLYYEYDHYGITLTFMAILWSIVIYVLSPIVLIEMYETLNIPNFTLSLSQISSVIPAIVTILFFGFMFIGNLSVRKNKYRFVIKRIDKSPEKIAFILFVFGFASVVFFIQSYGGLSYVLSYMSQIRSGSDDNKNYLGAFIFGFKIYIILSFYIYFSLFLKNNISKYGFLLLVITFVSSLFSLYISAGREVGISFLISSFLIYTAIKGRVPKTAMLLLSVIVILYIAFGKTLLFALNNENFDYDSFINNQSNKFFESVFLSVTKEFNHQYLSIVNFYHGDFNYRFFGDYVYWIFKPLKLFGINISDSIAYYNTYIIKDKWDSEVPPGAIAFGYIQLASIGVAIQGFLLGALFGFIDAIFNDKRHMNVLLLAFYALIVTSTTYLLSNADPALFVQNRIPHVLFILFLIVFGKARLAKVSEV